MRLRPDAEVHAASAASGRPSICPPEPPGDRRNRSPSASSSMNISRSSCGNASSETTAALPASPSAFLAAAFSSGVLRTRGLRPSAGGLAAGTASTGGGAASATRRRGVRRDVERHLEARVRVDEARNRMERHVQLLRHALERQPDLKRRIGDGQIPELVLQDHRHLARILGGEARGDAHARIARVEGHEEMVLAGKPGLRHLGQHLLDEAAQRLLREHIVADQVFGHGEGT